MRSQALDALELDELVRAALVISWTARYAASPKRACFSPRGVKKT